MKINPDGNDITEYNKFSWALELCIVLLNRIFFLKLLDGQLISYHNNNRDYNFMNLNRLGDYYDSHELFFEVLAIKECYRNDDIKNKYSNIPYLNSSLIDPLSDIEKQTVTIESLKDR